MRITKILPYVVLITIGLMVPMAYASHPAQISVQLYSVKEDVEKDFEGTLKQLSDWGFQGVEFAGKFGPYANDPVGLKKFLAKNNLKVSGAHVGFAKFDKEHFAATTSFYKAIGCYYLIVPFDKRAATLEGAKEVAQELTALDKKLRPLGLRTGYHNHKQEMVTIDGTTPWDVIAANTPKSVILQQDVGWTEAAGKDPVAVVKKYPHRMLTTHYKAAAPEAGNTENPIIGKDTTDWKALIKANQANGTEWFVIEQELDSEGLTRMQSVNESIKGLQNILTEMKKK